MPRIALLLAIAWSLNCSALGAQDPRASARVPRSSGPVSAPRPHESRLPVQLVRRDSQPEGVPSSGQADAPIPIPPPRAKQPSGHASRPRQSASRNVGLAVISSLAIVLGLFFLVVWLSRRALPKSATSLPTEVLEVLGRAPLASRHNLQLIRIGQRLLLVSVTPDNAETLTEITDATEVNHLSGLCRQHQPGSISSTFRQVLQQLGAHSEPRTADAKKSSDEETYVPTARFQRT